MSDWKAKARQQIHQKMAEGKTLADAISEVMPEFQTEALQDMQNDLAKRVKNELKNIWAEPPVNKLEQGQFDFGEVTFKRSDVPVRCVDDQGNVYYKHPRWSTPAEREDSLSAREDHHRSWMKRSQSELRREQTQNEIARENGFDMGAVWDEWEHHSPAANTKCWRCGLGWRAGDPFERGHSDRPESQGGTQVEWEHRSCNRSAQDNPVARPEDDMPEDDMPEDDAS